jgi:hypothetical protein
MVDLDDRTALAAGGPFLSRRLIYSGGVCAGQGGSSSGTASKLWINNCGSGGPSQAIPQRIYIFAMESFVGRREDRENPLNQAWSAAVWLSVAGRVCARSLLTRNNPHFHAYEASPRTDRKLFQFLSRDGGGSSKLATSFTRAALPGSAC